MERKVVLITGGAMGQGRAHALKFAENGFDVVLADMQDPAGEVFSSTVKEIEALGVKALAVRCNITSDSDMKVLFEKSRSFICFMEFLPEQEPAPFIRPVFLRL